MNLLGKREVVNIQLFNAEISASELEIYRLCMKYVLKHADPKQIEAEFGAYPDEILGMMESVEDVMQQVGLQLDEEDAPVELAVEER